MEVLFATNALMDADLRPFVLVGDLESLDVKFFWYKVHCILAHITFNCAHQKRTHKITLRIIFERTKHAKVVDGSRKEKASASTLIA